MPQTRIRTIRFPKPHDKSGYKVALKVALHVASRPRQIPNPN
jgi:hypothetical protein